VNQQENVIETTIPEEQLWENLKISNDFMFAKVMRNPELCKGMLERLLDIRIDHIEYPEEQKVIDIARDSKSVRLDVYIHDEKNTVCNSGPGCGGDSRGPQLHRDDRAVNCNAENGEESRHHEETRCGGEPGLHFGDLL